MLLKNCKMAEQAVKFVEENSGRTLEVYLRNPNYIHKNVMLHSLNCNPTFRDTQVILRDMGLQFASPEKQRDGILKAIRLFSSWIIEDYINDNYLHAELNGCDKHRWLKRIPNKNSDFIKDGIPIEMKWDVNNIFYNNLTLPGPVYNYGSYIKQEAILLDLNTNKHKCVLIDLVEEPPLCDGYKYKNIEFVKLEEVGEVFEQIVDNRRNMQKTLNFF